MVCHLITHNGAVDDIAVTIINGIVPPGNNAIYDRAITITKAIESHPVLSQDLATTNHSIMLIAHNGPAWGQ